MSPLHRLTTILLSYCTVQILARSVPDHDLVITVKTTQKFHPTRVREVVDTWYQDVPNDVYFVTDAFDAELNKEVHGHLMSTKCAAGHTREALSCKMAEELRIMVEKKARWSCHFDDDNYVNVPALRSLLSRLDHTQSWYIGKASTSAPFSVGENEFWFGTGGAGVCLSRTLLSRMSSLILSGGFETISQSRGLPDDVTLGYIIAELFDTPLTRLNSLHSHLENLSSMREDSIDKQISLSGTSNNRIPLRSLDVSYFKSIRNSIRK